MQPCGTPVLRMRVEELWFSNLTDLLVRKSSIKLLREVLMPRPSLVISLEGMMLN